MADDRINETRNGEAVNQIAHEAGPSDHGARCNRRARVGKRELKEPERQESHAAGFIGCGSALQEKPVITDEAVAMAEHEREAKSKEEQAAKARIDDTFHQHIDG